MPYKDIDELPEDVKNVLPKHAQEIYKEAYNSARKQHKGEDELEATSHKIAWSAVKNVYEKWVKKTKHN